MTVEVNVERQNFYQMLKNLFIICKVDVRVALLFWGLCRHVVLCSKLHDFNVRLISGKKYISNWMQYKNSYILKIHMVNIFDNWSESKFKVNQKLDANKTNWKLQIAEGFTNR